jgi:uncharacterized protein with ParB-like and HNH nuclease domain
MDVYLPKYGRNLQRDLCWTLENKRELIWSMIKGNYVPSLTACILFDEENNKDTYQIIDGKQRLSTIFQFINNEFSIEFRGQEYFYKDLDYDIIHELVHYFPLVKIVRTEGDWRNLTDDEKIQLYLRLNFTGVPQNKEYLEELSKLAQSPKTEEQEFKEFEEDFCAPLIEELNEIQDPDGTTAYQHAAEIVSYSKLQAVSYINSKIQCGLKSAKIIADHISENL